MHRTEGANNIGNLFVDSLPGTRVEENWLNATQEELCGFIEGAGLTLKTAITETRDQLNTALRTVFAPMVAGTKMWFYQNVAPAGWTLDAVPGDELLAVKGGAQAYNVAGGTVAGSWTVAGLTKDAHTHAFTQPNGHGNHAALTVNAHTNHTALALNNHTALALNNENAHTHTGPNHNHEWYIGNAAANHDQTYNAAGNVVSIPVGVGKDAGRQHLIYSSVVTDLPTNDAWTNKAGTGATAAGSIHAHTFSQNITAHGFSQNITAHSAHVFGTNIDAHSAHAGGSVNAQSNATISSAGSWRPKARLGIICTKD